MRQSQTSSATSRRSSTGGAGTLSDAETSLSCRYPLLLLCLSATGWLLLATVLGFIATLKFHALGLLADNAWFTYGRVHPAALNALVYGFAIQAGLAVVMWVFTQIGKNNLACAPLAVGGWLLWNTGITLGVAGILYGDSTGYEWLEMPRYGIGFNFCGYLLLAVAALATFHQRRERTLTVSHWFMVTALFWFPWIYATATWLLVIGTPVRGALQYVVDSWYVNNLNTAALGFVALGTIFYFVPKISQRPLNSFYTGIFIFASLLLFGCWARIPAATPLPAWLSSFSTMGALTTIAPAIGVIYVVFRTRCRCSELKPLERSIQRFAIITSLAYGVSTVLGAVTSTLWFSKITHFTWFVPANAQLFLYGVVVFSLFCGLYSLIPKILGAAFPSPGLVTAHFYLATLGILLYAVPLMFGGIKQGEALNDPAVPFVSVMTATLMPLRTSSMGDVCMALGHLLFAANFLGLVFKTLRVTAAETVTQLTAEVAS